MGGCETGQTDHRKRVGLFEVVETEREGGLEGGGGFLRAFNTE